MFTPSPPPPLFTDRLHTVPQCGRVAHLGGGHCDEGGGSERGGVNMLVPTTPREAVTVVVVVAVRSVVVVAVLAVVAILAVIVSFLFLL